MLPVLFQGPLLPSNIRKKGSNANILRDITTLTNFINDDDVVHSHTNTEVVPFIKGSQFSGIITKNFPILSESIPVIHLKKVSLYKTAIRHTSAVA